MLGALALRGEGAVISEIMYHPASTNRLEEWFELHNLGNHPVDLSGWRIASGVAFTFPANTSLAGGGYLVVAADAATFAASHPTVTNFVAGWVGTLSHDGEELRLEDAQGNLVNSVHYAPEGDWAARRIGPVDSLGCEGWEWYAEHDGLGKSLELINGALPNAYGQNWTSSTVLGGTPAAANSVASTNIAPLLLDVAHSPTIPRSTDPVTVTARVLDEQTGGLTVTLSWRADGTASFDTVPMADDGAHGDAVAGDGVFGSILPTQPDGTIVEFFLSATDAENRTRVYPNVIPSGTARTANLVYQVDDSVSTGDQPVLRLIIPQAEYDYLAEEIWGGEPRSDALVSGTFLSVDGVLDGGTTMHCRYQCGFRNRGHGTRTSVPHNFHVAFPKDRPWKGRGGLNLNTHYTHSQQLGSALFRRLGMPMADSRPVQVRLNGANLAKAGQEQFGSYVANEVVDDRLVKRQFPLDSEGNLYRGIRDMIPGISADADLAWHGSSYSSYTNAYAKENNAAVNDWSDLLHLIDVLHNTPDADYPAEVAKVLNVDQWMKFFAVNTLLDNQENSLGIGSGDDYSLYRGTKDTRFLLLPYDMDALMGRGLVRSTYADGLWRMTNVSAINRFMKRPEFVPLYFQHLEQLAATAFAPAEMNPLLDHLFSAYVDATAIANMKAFNTSHVAYVLSLFPRTLTAASFLSVSNGYPRTTASTVALHGTGNAIHTRQVLVNGLPATWTAWQGTWTNNAVALTPGLNRILVQALGADGSEVGRTNIDIWHDDDTVASAGGTVTADTTWGAAGGPYLIASSLTVHAGATLTIEPGTTVYLGTGANLTVANGGRLLAEGREDAPIRFTRQPGSTTSWGGITINGAVGSPETRISHAFLEFFGGTAIHVAAGTVSLDHLEFGTTDHQYLALDGASFVVRDCVFPSPTTTFEPVHGTGGVKSGGRALFLHNYFGTPIGYNDVVDFTGGNRPGGPLVQFIDNVFTGATDDILDLDGTDAWVEGNIFLHVHRNGSPDSSSAVSGGSDGGNTSEVTIIGNLFYDCDHAATAKQGNFYTLINNTIVHQTKTGGLDTDAAVVNFADDGTTEGGGMYLEANIIDDVEKLTRNLTAATVTFTNNLLPLPWTGSGGGNSTNAPLFVHVPEMSETVFATWEEAQVMRQWLSLLPGSPARRTGPAGLDCGGVLPIGIAVAGPPAGTNNLTTATLNVDSARTGNGIPTAGFPLGSGYTHYRYRLDGGSWSGETPVATPIQLRDLANGPHQVDVSGKRDVGMYQDDPANGTEAVLTTLAWTVDTNFSPPATSPVLLNEVLARNGSVFTNLGIHPDLIELVNRATQAVDLSGMGLTDNAGMPYKFSFPAGTTLAGGAFLVLVADDGAGGPFLHTGFGLKASGDDLYLFDKPSGAGLLDSVVFGLQVADLSLGRRTDGTWGLCQPTFGAANVALATGDSHRLKINEWLADAAFTAQNDFLELYNPEPQPVDLGGLFLSDAAGAPNRYAIPALSYIPANGYAEFVADADPEQGADHLNFKLAPDVGLILLSAPDLTLIDAVNYGSQRTDVSEGRSPNGSSTFTMFRLPTPGGGNPGADGSASVVTTTVPLLPLSASWRYNQMANLDGTVWHAPTYNDSAWPSGPALLGVESSTLPAPGLTTALSLGRTTYYFRTTFVVDTNLSGFDLNATTVVDDGVIVYLNGTPILTNGMDTGTPAYATLASRTVGNAATEFFTLPGSALREGTNVLAAEVHQVSSGSSDIVWGMAVDASRTVTNPSSTVVVPVVLNELRTRAPTAADFGEPAADFVELYNPSTNTVDLSGLSLTDDSSFPRKWVFASGTTIEAGAYLVIGCDSARPSSATNTGFGLKASGGAVFLFQASTGSGPLLDAVAYGLQTPAFSIGRVPSGSGEWTLTIPSPGTANTAAGLASVSVLRVNEWMADPADGSDWFEIYNSSSQPVALEGLCLTDDLIDKTQSPLPPLSFIGTGADAWVRFVADGDLGAGGDHVSFSLKKTGESLGLFSPTGFMIDGVAFGAQDAGVSEGRFPDGSATVTRFPETPSPGGSNYLPLENAVVNEVLTHTDPPLEDAVELFNPTGVSVDVGGWYLSNTKQDYRKYRIPNGTILPAGGFLTFYEAQFDSTNGVPFTFNSAHGDAAILSEADATGNLTGFRSQVEFGAAANGVSFGRYATSTGVDFTALRARTFGADNPATVEEFRTGTGLANAAPLVGPLVVNEIFYLPLDHGVEDPTAEFVEIQNVSTTDIPLFDPAYPTNTWKLREAVDFDFPTNTVLATGARLLVVGFDAADPSLVASFRARFGVPAEVPILGPWSGRLANDHESVAFVRPDTVQQEPHPDAGYVPQVLVDRVHYSALAPWPTAAANGGNSLQRLEPGAYGNDPVNWFAAAPSPGLPNTAAPADSDSDGMPDAWELAHFGSLGRDGNGDFDADGLTDLQEYLAGTSPTNASDLLEWTSISYGTPLALEFAAVAGKAYSVQYRNSLATGEWQTLVDIPVQSVAGPLTVTDSDIPNGSRYYRILAR